MQLLADMALPAKNFGLHSESTDAGDAFVLIHLAFLFFVLGIGLFSAWLLWRRQAKPEPHVRLMIELEEEQCQFQESPPSQSGRRGENAGAAWERDPEWWREEEKDDGV